MKLRRVVTAEHPDGRSFIAVDDSCEPTLISQLPGSAFHRVWSSDDRVQFPTETPGFVGGTMFPPPAGFRFMFVTFPPDSMHIAPEDIDVEQMTRELAERLPNNPGDSDMDPNGYEGNHRTNTVDMGVVLSGQVDLKVDDGVVTLRQGDCIIQGGARHAWYNPTDEPCVVAFVIVGGDRRP